mmetsp:Transcript_35450/g.56706  ORF Transcript_35450/g.56706 Transcript_35450/m.56706 type:complete len:237 (-) Transcript_35450:227-937(-)
MLDSSGVTLSGSVDWQPCFRYVAFWQAARINSRDIERLINNDLARINLSDAPDIDDSLLRAIAAKAPPLEELILRNICSCSSNMLGKALAAISATLVMLDLSETTVRTEFPQVELPQLKILLLDRTEYTDSLGYLFRTSKVLEVISMLYCSGITDDSFIGCEQQTVLATLRVARLSGTRIGAYSVGLLRSKPLLRLLLLESCRDVPRKFRLDVYEWNGGRSFAVEVPQVRVGVGLK